MVRRPARLTRRSTTVLAAALLVAVPAMAPPPPVVLACGALAVVSGLLSGFWGWLAQSRTPAGALRLGLAGALLGGVLAASLLGMVSLLGAAVVPVLTAGYLLAAAVWVMSRPSSGPSAQ